MSTTALIDLYLKYTEDTESPRNYHRWVWLSLVGTLIGRNCWIPFGDGVIYPNQYILLVGNPGVRKGTAISLGKRLVKESGYESFGPNKAAKETMWYEMARMAGQLNGEEYKATPDPEEVENLMELDLETLFENKEDSVAHMYICADEFTAFLGHGNDELITSLTDLWDNLDYFYNPKLGSKSVTVYNPTVSIMSGTTPESIASAFPAAVIGGGFTSRLLLIHGESNKRIAWPSKPDQKIKKVLLKALEGILQRQGPILPNKEAKQILAEIYNKAPKISDRRFDYYSQRRHTHLLKLCMIHTLMRNDDKITPEDALRANTTLYLAERMMPRALGHFGKARASSVANSVLDAIYNTPGPLGFKDLWRMLSQDCGKETELKDVLVNLIGAEKIQKVNAKSKTGRRMVAYLPKKVIAKEWVSHLVDYSLMTEEERP